MVFRDSEGNSPRYFTVRDMNGGKDQDKRYPHHVHLSAGFLKTKMKAVLADFDHRQEKEGKIIDIGCPLCQQGSLKLKSVEALPRSAQVKDVQIGNRYEYVCSNPECRGYFTGGCLFVSH